ncbi:MAG: ATP-binding protein [Oscillospiraceae bacterium]|nr:ATP-binding protein [Oscillospiraceae bacterium]
MSTLQRIKILIVAFAILAGTNLFAFIFAVRAETYISQAYEERYALSSARFEFSLASAALTRWMRFVAITGAELQYNAFWAEIERARPNLALDAFIAFDAPRSEIELMEELVAHRSQINALSADVFRLRAEGRYEDAIALAHGQKITDLEAHLTATLSVLTYSLQTRTQATVDLALFRLNVLEIIVIATSALLALTGILGLVLAAKVKHTRLLRGIGAAFLVIVIAYPIFLAGTMRLSREKIAAYELRESLVTTVYGMESSTETLTKLLRVFVVTGCEMHYSAYRKELAQDTFERAMEIFLTMRAPSSEINMLVDFVGRMHTLRQVEARAIVLHRAGYVQNAIATAFGQAAAAVGIPTNALSNEIRENVAARTQETVNSALRVFDTFSALLLTVTLLLIATGLWGLLALHRKFAFSESPHEGHVESYIAKLTKGKHITIRLVASFVLIISIFAIYVAITSIFNNAIGELNRHNFEYMTVQSESLLTYHQEFTEMRRILQESFMNQQWLEYANTAFWRSFEQMLSESHARLSYLAKTYITSVLSDQVFPALPDDSRIYAMTSIMAFTDKVYEIFKSNFFLSGNMSLAHYNVLDGTADVEIMLRMLRHMLATHQQIVTSNIEQYQNMANAAAVIALVAATVFALCLALLMVKSFTGRIKAIEAKAALVEQGNFEDALQDAAADEISIIFSNLVGVFLGLIEEISEAVRKNAAGDEHARINSERFHGGYQKAAHAINVLMDTIKEAEKFREAEERILLMLDSTPMSMCMFDANLKSIACNQEAVRMFAADSKAHFLNDNFPFTPLFQPSGENSRALFNSFLAEAFEKGSSHASTFICERADGTPFPTEIFFVRVEYKGGYAVVEYARDLSDLKAAIEKEHIAEAESLAKTRFLAHMSHEIRTPMNSVLGIAELQLQSGGHPPETEEAFSHIYSSASMLLAIINDILDLSKIEADKLEILHATYEVTSIIVEAVQLNVIDMDSKHLDFKLEVDDQLPTHLVGDALRIKQILNNLLSNAFKYTQEGRVSLSFHAEQTENPDEVLLRICVKDTGQGMTNEQLTHLFESEFTRFNTNINPTIEGSGLGMMITHRIVTMMRGSIIAESEFGVGSMFTVRIPQILCGTGILGKEVSANLQNTMGLLQSSRKIAKLVREPIYHGKVLIVDDVESNLYVLKSSLLPYKINVESATSGHGAIEKINAGNVYDIIFMDYMMPGLDGMETTMAIRKLGYGHPIVALTANTLKGVEEMFLNKGFDEFLSKPIDLKRLDECLVRYMGRMQPSESIESAQRQYYTENKTPADLKNLLELFSRDAIKAIDTLEPLAIAENLDDDALREYVIHTHAMKSALHNIGRIKLSQFASVLEDAGRAGDIDIIKAHTASFLTSLGEIIKEFLMEDDQIHDEFDEDLNFLGFQLDIVREACAQLDFDAANDALYELSKKRCSKNTRHLIKDITANLLYGDFQEASKLATLLKKDAFEQ